MDDSDVITSNLGTEVQQILLIDDDLKVIDEFSKKKLCLDFSKSDSRRFFLPVYIGNLVFYHGIPVITFEKTDRRSSMCKIKVTRKQPQKTFDYHF